ncbi:TrbI/VirB10 family protein [bacterium]|nr:TrbI/VirB10 family protein [bacterium]
MAIFNKKKTEAQATSPSDENAKMLPPEKQSKSDISTKQTNTILLFIAFIMLGIFVVGAIFTANKNQNDMGAINQATSKETTTTTLTETFTYISPIVSSDPQTVKFENIIVGNETFNSIMISVANNPIKISDISFSTQVDGLSFDEDCTQRESITPEAGCIINLVWNPTKVENKNIFLLLTYNDPDSQNSPDDPQSEKGKNRTYKINVALSSMEKPAPATQISNEEEEDDFYDEEEYDDEYEDEDDDFEPATQSDVRRFTNAVAPAISQSQTQRTVYPDDCKKYASKAYDFSGTFIGWVQKNNDVFSPNCTKVIGSLQEDGMVLETGTGKLIGKGAVFDKKKAEEKRIETDLPLLEEVMETINAENFNPDFEQVWNNRTLIKAEQKRESTEEYDLYKADDPLNIIGKQKNALVPFSIKTSDQISSMPKDERYVLRQAKPIPAVLNRPIYFGNIDKSEIDGTVYREDSTTAVATVERNVYGGDGRTIIIPSGSQLIGQAQAPASGGLQEIAKISIDWQRLIRPDGAEFDLTQITNYTADAQGREGVPGKNDTEYMRDLFMKPLLYSVLPVAMEALFPTSSQFVTRAKRSDGTYQALDTFLNEDGETDVDFASDETSYGWSPTDTQTIANMSSKDKMKLEIEQNWKTTMQKLMEQSAQQSIPFTVAAGTRIMIFLDQDVMLRIDEDMSGLIDEQYEQ